MDGAVKFDGVTINWKAAQEEVATGATASMRGRETLGIGMNIEDHIGGTVANLSIGMCPHVVEELVDLFLGVLCGCSLLCGNGREGHKDSCVDGLCIV